VFTPEDRARLRDALLSGATIYRVFLLASTPAG
jgi:hypothetical protein